MDSFVYMLSPDRKNATNELVMYRAKIEGACHFISPMNLVHKCKL
jgi:hypothetical protein